MTPRPLATGRRLAARTSLRVKLIVAVLALVAVALALISLASVTALRGYLVGRLDNQLQQEARRSAGGPPPGGEGPGPRRGPRSPYLVQDRDAAGRLDQELSNQLLQQASDRPGCRTTPPGCGPTPATWPRCRPPAGRAAGGWPWSRWATARAAAWSWPPAWTGPTAPSASSG